MYKSHKHIFHFKIFRGETIASPSIDRIDIFFLKENNHSFNNDQMKKNYSIFN